MRQAVDQVEIYGGKPELARPFERLLRHRARLDAMHGFLNLWIKVLHTEGGSVESGVAQSNDVVASQPARINFDSRFIIIGERGMTPDDVTEPPDFVR